MKLPNPPKLVRFMIRHALNGIVIGCLFVFGIIWFDVMGIGTLLEKDSSGIATFILFFQVAMTFGGVSIGIAVMNLGEDED